MLMEDSLGPPPPKQKMAATLAAVGCRLLVDFESAWESAGAAEAAPQAAGADPASLQLLAGAAAAFGTPLRSCAVALQAAWEDDNGSMPHQLRRVASQQLVQLGVLRPLERVLHAVGGVVLDSGGQLSAAAAGQPDSWRALCTGLAAWVGVLVRVWPETRPGNLLTSAAAGPVMMAAAPVLLASLLLGAAAIAAAPAAAGPSTAAADADAEAEAAVAAAELGISADACHALVCTALAAVPSHQDFLLACPLMLAGAYTYLHVVLAVLLLSTCLSSSSSSGGGGASSSGSGRGSGSSSSSRGSDASSSNSRGSGASSSASSSGNSAGSTGSQRQLAQALGLCAATLDVAVAVLLKAGTFIDAPNLACECVVQLVLLCRSCGDGSGAAGDFCAALSHAAGPDEREQRRRHLVALMSPVPCLLLGFLAACIDASQQQCEVVFLVAAHAADTLLWLSTQPGLARVHLPRVLAHTAALLEWILDGEGGVDPASAMVSVYQLFGVLRGVFHVARGRAAAAVAAWQADVVARVCAASEALLRQGAAAASCGVLLESDKSLSVLAGLLCRRPPRADCPLSAAVSNMPAVTSHLFSLRITCLKVLHTDMSIKLWHSVAGQVIAAVTVDAAEGWASERRAGSIIIIIGSSSSSSSSRGGSQAAAAPSWLTLLAHAMFQAGVLLAATLAGAQSSSGQPVASVISGTTDLVSGICLGLMEFRDRARGGSSSLAALAAGLSPAAAEALTAGAAGVPAAAAAAAAPAALQAAQAAAEEWLEQTDRVLMPFVSHAALLLMRAERAASGSGSGSSDDDAASGSGSGDTVEALALPAALEAAGVDRDFAALEAAQDAPAVLRVVQDSFVATSLPSALQAASLRVSALLPHRFSCNFPGCTNLAEASELALVSGKRCICMGCRTARYCGEACQLAHWPHHKPVCRRLRREAEAAASRAGDEEVAAQGVAASSGSPAG